MAGTNFESGAKICEGGQPMTSLHLIAKGSVKASYPGGSYKLTKGDVIGIGEVASEVHFLTYTALEETNLLSYPMASLDALDNLLKSKPDVARLFLLSLYRQISTLLQKSNLSEMQCTALHSKLNEDTSLYRKLCETNNIPPKDLVGMDAAEEYVTEEQSDLWLASYYQGLTNLYTAEISKNLIAESDVSIGLLRKGSLDFRKTFSVLKEHAAYCTKLTDLYFNPTENDLFGYLASLYYRIGSSSEEGKFLGKRILQIADEMASTTSLSAPAYEARVENFKTRIAQLGDGNPDEAGEFGNSDISSSAIYQELAGSMDVILEYSECSGELDEALRKHLASFKKLEDKNSSSDVAGKLRKSLTKDFYELYGLIFEKALTASYLPLPVRMFLFFGYIDEELASMENCLVLHRLTCGMQPSQHLGVYTFFDWLSAIYEGEKDPSRNEFDEDFIEYVHKQKASGNLTESQAKQMETDPMARVRFELENLFPTVNKITYGRITTFCPFFVADNVLRDLNSSFLDAAKIRQALDNVRAMDYSAYYRDGLDYENIDLMGKEMIHQEFLPDVILMPNVGIRGVMWQEIEGRRRNTPGRFFLSLFHLEDVNMTMIRLTGEFRWELCKRMQGARWNDVSEASLTSEYFDYIQFYRRNHELSADAKDRIKTSLQKAKNSFKEMFVRDYILWILFEGAGSPRLNKIARKILFTYCPFTASVNEKIGQSPLFSELLEHRGVVVAQQLHHLDVLEQKIKAGGNSVPQTLIHEKEFLQGRV